MLTPIIILFIFSIIYVVFYNNKRNLIYICFTGEKYFNLAKLLIRTIDKFLTRNDVDILLCTNSDTLELCNNWLYKEWTPSNKNINFIYSISDEPFHLYRFIINDIFKSYNKILYLDTDILIVSDSINNLFDECLNKNTLYVVHEHTNYNDYTHSFIDKKYTSHEQLVLQKRNIYPFNNGQFMFIYSDIMKHHFDNIIYIIKTKEYNICIDQQAMNVYFNNLFLSKSGIIDKYTKLFAKDSTILKQSTQCPFTRCIMHFCGNIHDGDKKKEHMLIFLDINNIKI